MPDDPANAELAWTTSAGRLATRIVQFVFAPLFLGGFLVRVASDSWPAQPTAASLAYGSVLIASIVVAVVLGAVGFIGRLATRAN